MGDLTSVTPPPPEIIELLNPKHQSWVGLAISFITIFLGALSALGTIKQTFEPLLKNMGKSKEAINKARLQEAKSRQEILHLNNSIAEHKTSISKYRETLKNKQTSIIQLNKTISEYSNDFNQIREYINFIEKEINASKPNLDRIKTIVNMIKVIFKDD